MLYIPMAIQRMIFIPPSGMFFVHTISFSIFFSFCSASKCSQFCGLTRLQGQWRLQHTSNAWNNTSKGTDVQTPKSTQNTTEGEKGEKEREREKKQIFPLVLKYAQSIWTRDMAGNCFALQTSSSACLSTVDQTKGNSGGSSQAITHERRKQKKKRNSCIHVITTKYLSIWFE